MSVDPKSEPLPSTLERSVLRAIDQAVERATHTLLAEAPLGDEAEQVLSIVVPLPPSHPLWQGTLRETARLRVYSRLPANCKIIWSGADLDPFHDGRHHVLALRLWALTDPRQRLVPPGSVAVAAPTTNGHVHVEDVAAVKA